MIKLIIIVRTKIEFHYIFVCTFRIFTVLPINKISKSRVFLIEKIIASIVVDEWKIFFISNYRLTVAGRIIFCRRTFQTFWLDQFPIYFFLPNLWTFHGLSLYKMLQFELYLIHTYTREFQVFRTLYFYSLSSIFLCIPNAHKRSSQFS